MDLFIWHILLREIFTAKTSRTRRQWCRWNMIIMHLPSLLGDRRIGLRSVEQFSRVIVHRGTVISLLSKRRITLCGKTACGSPGLRNDSRPRYHRTRQRDGYLQIQSGIHLFISSGHLCPSYWAHHDNNNESPGMKLLYLLHTGYAIDCH